MPELENAAPEVYEKAAARRITSAEMDNNVADPFDAREIFDLIRDIYDPEHPLSLEELNIVDEDRIHVDDEGNRVLVEYTPTIPHCSVATLIGLAIRVKLFRTLPARFKVSVRISDGSHVSEHAINKQLADKERVAAALENSNLMDVINHSLRDRD